LHEKVRRVIVQPLFAWFKKRKPSIIQKNPPYELPMIIENRNAASTAGPAHFPRMQEVEGVEPLPIKTQHHAHNLYPAFAFKPSVLAIPAFCNLHL